MEIVIATGCSQSGWEMALPTLWEAEFRIPEDFSRWNEELFETNGVTDTLQVKGPLAPGIVLKERAADFLSEDPTRPVLLADSRSLYALDFWASKFPQAKFLLFYTRLETAVAHAFTEGIEPHKILDAWMSSNRQLLQFRRRYRHRALLVDAEAAVRHKKELFECCCKFGIDVSIPTDISPSEVVSLPVEGVLAGTLMAKNRSVISLHEELEASAHPLGEKDSSLQPDELFHTFLQRQESERRLQNQLAESNEKLGQAEQEQLELQAAHKDAAQENELLSMQLHKIQEELEGAYLRIKEVEQAQNISEDQLKQLQEQNTKLTSARDEQTELAAERQKSIEKLQEARQKLEVAHKDAAQEKELLLMQLHKVQKELEDLFLRHQNLKQGNQRNENVLHHLRNELQSKERELEKQLQRIARLKTTASWKMTAPVRVVARPFKKSGKKKDDTQELMKLVRDSGLFDEPWYLAENADVAEAGLDPVEHYLRHGAAEGRNPSPQFNSYLYLDLNPDVAASEMNPLVHYIKYGREEGRRAI